MALPQYTTIYTNLTTPGDPIQQQIIVALWMAINPILTAGTAPNLASVQFLATQILNDPQLVQRVGFRIMNTILASLPPTDASIQTAVTALIPATAPFQL